MLPKCGDRVGAHDLRRDEQVHAVDQAGGQQRRVEARAGFGDQREDAFLAELIENLAEGDAARFSGQHLHADAAIGAAGGCGSRLLRR